MATAGTLMGVHHAVLKIKLTVFDLVADALCSVFAQHGHYHTSLTLFKKAGGIQGVPQHNSLFVMSMPSAHSVFYTKMLLRPSESLY